MEDAKYVYFKDIQERKNISHSAFSKKNGVKSKKCTLPSDNLTPAQRRRKNSEVITMNHEAITWSKFKKFSKGTQQEYLTWLQDTYRAATIGNIAKMFGVSRNTLNSYVKNASLVLQAKNGSFKDADILAWNDFLKKNPFMETVWAFEYRLPGEHGYIKILEKLDSKWNGVQYKIRIEYDIPNCAGIRPAICEKYLSEKEMRNYIFAKVQRRLI